MEELWEEQICCVCSFHKFHDNDLLTPPKHFTCLCELYKRKYICCKKGFSNLIKNVPYISIYCPNPEVINTCYIQNSSNYIPSDKSIIEILSFSYEQKLEVLQTQIFLFEHHPYFKYGKK